MPPLPGQALFSSELTGWGQERGGTSLGRQDTCCVLGSLQIAACAVFSWKNQTSGLSAPP